MFIHYTTHMLTFQRVIIRQLHAKSLIFQKGVWQESHAKCIHVQLTVNLHVLHKVDRLGCITMLMMTAYLAQHQQKPKLISIQNMSGSVCNLICQHVLIIYTINFLFLLLLLMLYLVKHSMIAAAIVTTQSISTWLVKAA